MRIEPGTPCIVTGGQRIHNLGKGVTAIRIVSGMGQLPEFEGMFERGVFTSIPDDVGNVWVVEGNDLLNEFKAEGRAPFLHKYSIYKEEHLTPIRGDKDPDFVEEDTTVEEERVC